MFKTSFKIRETMEQNKSKIYCVTYKGEGVLVLKEAMNELGLKSGQDIDSITFTALLEFNIARCKSKIASSTVFKKALREV